MSILSRCLLECLVFCPALASFLCFQASSLSLPRFPGRLLGLRWRKNPGLAASGGDWASFIYLGRNLKRMAARYHPSRPAGRPLNMGNGVDDGLGFVSALVDDLIVVLRREDAALFMQPLTLTLLFLQAGSTLQPDA